MAEWIEANTRPSSTQFVCSECNKIVYYSHGRSGRNTDNTKYCGYKYCPHCGIMMQE